MLPMSDVTPAMPQIKTVVYLMLENRGLDHLLGFLYPDGEKPSQVYPPGSSADYNGLTPEMSNVYKNACYQVTNGTGDGGQSTADLETPNRDPHETFPHVGTQMYGDAQGNMPDGYFWSQTPTMQGFVRDYSDLHLTKPERIMETFSATQLPVLHGLARSYAISDRWFSSIPTETDPNRAFSLCGTSLGAVLNSEIHGEALGDTFKGVKTLFNALGNAGKSWGLYWQSRGIASMALPWDVYTPYFFPELKKAPNGGVHEFDEEDQPDSFMQALKNGTLPEFCYLEPVWGGGPATWLKIQGTDYHPSASVGPGEYYLNELYEALINSPQWPNMLLIVTFDEHGGTFDHEPPPKTVPPDDVVGSSGFRFDRLGPRVPTLLISPFAPEGMVFRSDVPDADFDHTSIIATLLAWAGVDPAEADMGARVAQAPRFDGALSETARTDKPTFTVPESYRTSGDILDDIAGPKDGAPRRVNIQDYRALCEGYDGDDEAFKQGLRGLLFGDRTA
jgi:phospholipase C